MADSPNDAFTCLIFTLPFWSGEQKFEALRIVIYDFSQCSRRQKACFYFFFSPHKSSYFAA